MYSGGTALHVPFVVMESDRRRAADGNPWAPAKASR